MDFVPGLNAPKKGNVLLYQEINVFVVFVPMFN